MIIRKLRDLFGNHIGAWLTFSFIIFSILSWILLFRDGRGLYTFVRFYPFLDPYVKSGVIVLNKLGLNTIPTGIFALFAIFSFCLYISSLKQNITLKMTIIYSIIFQVITYLFSYPILAKDIFYYIFSDRVLLVYHANIWKIPVSHFSFDKFAWTDWQTQIKVYGGINQFFYNFASVIGGNDLIRSLFAYKGLTFIFSVLTMYLLYKILKTYYPGRESFNLRLLFWNPLFILEIIGAGHNDIIMIFFALLSFYFYLKKKSLLSGIILALSMQVKIVTIFIFPFVAIKLFAEKKYKDLVYFCFGFILTNLIVFRFMGVNPIEFLKRVFFNLGVYWQSLPNMIFRLVGEEKTFFFIALILVGGAFAAYQYIKKENPFVVFAEFIFVYLLFLTSAYWNWYVLWAFFLVPFIRNKKLSASILVFSFTSLLAYPLYWLSLRFNYQSLVWPVITYLFIFGIPIAFLVFFKLQKNNQISKKMIQIFD